MKSLFFLMLLCIFSAANAQFDKPKFGKIDMSEMAMSKYDKDTTAEALTLFDAGSTKIILNRERRFQYVYERHCRIKIFKKSAFDIADMSIRLFKEQNAEEKLSGLDAVTYNLVDGKIVKTKLESNKIYTEESKSYNDKKFAFPDVKEGSIIEFSYNITSDFLYNFRGWVFQRRYPALWSEYTFMVPEYFDYRKSSRGYLPFDINKNDIKRERFVLHYESEITNKSAEGRIPAKDYEIFAQTYITTLGIKDVPAFKSESDIDCDDNYTQSIEFELSSIQYPDEIRRDFTHSWESVNKQMMEDEDFGRLLKSDGFINDTVARLCQNVTDNKEKARIIFNYVQRWMKWNGEYRIFAKRGLKKPYIERAGSSSEINLLLTLMFQTAGLNADPVMFSTRENGDGNSVFPTITKFNSVLASVEISGTRYLLDATNDYCGFGILPANDINGRGRLIKETGSGWVDLSTTEKYKRVCQYSLEITPEGTFKGTIVRTSDGYAGIEYRSMLSNEKSMDDYMRKMQENIPGLSIIKYSVANKDIYNKPIVDTLYVDIDNSAEVIGDKIIFKPLLFETINKNRYTLEERKYPIDYNYPIAEMYIFDYVIPKGYQVESMPQGASMKMPDGSISITYSGQAADNKIKLMYRRTVNKILFLPEEYANLKEMYNQIVKKHAEQIILKKVNL
ncbi:MAG TPA: DUF3857 domain-containing protein [Bacteroidales bacterium]|nr:DUF3857 domain-containing protein [Bacteroidales bacterium]